MDRDICKLCVRIANDHIKNDIVVYCSLRIVGIIHTYNKLCHTRTCRINCDCLCIAVTITADFGNTFIK